MSNITQQHLEDAAMAAGVKLEYRNTSDAYYYDDPETGREEWRPHLDDGAAFRLAATIGISVGTRNPEWSDRSTSYAFRPPGWNSFEVLHERSDRAATEARRTVIVLCAAEVGRKMREGGDKA